MQQHGRAHALAAAHLDVLAHLRDELDARLEMARELALDTRQFLADRFEDLGEIRNGRRGGIHREAVSPEGSLSKNLRESDHRFRRGVNAANATERARGSCATTAGAELASARHAANRRQIDVSVSTTQAGSLRLPRYGTGARNGASVSTSSRSSGTNARDLAQRLGLRERHDAGQRDVEPEVERPPRLVERAAEAVHDAAHTALAAFRRTANVSSVASRVWMTTGSAAIERQRRSAPRTPPAGRRAARSRSGSRGRSRRRRRPRPGRSPTRPPSAAASARPAYAPARCGWTAAANRTVRPGDADDLRRARPRRARRPTGCTAPTPARRPARGPRRRRGRRRTSRRPGGSGSRSWTAEPGPFSRVPRSGRRTCPGAGRSSPSNCHRRSRSACRRRGWRRGPCRSTRCPSASPA